MKAIEFLLNIATALLGIYLSIKFTAADFWAIFIFGGFVVSAIRLAVVLIPWLFK